jgi:hypothetical protein
MPFGKYKGQTVEEVLHTNPGYLEWICENFTEGKVKKAAMEALASLKPSIQKKQTDVPSRMRISLIRDNSKFYNGILFVELTQDLLADFEELHEACRTLDPVSGMWFVPVSLLGDIIERFPQSEIDGELQYSVAWTEPTKLARGRY